eukprot:82279_1
MEAHVNQHAMRATRNVQVQIELRDNTTYKTIPRSITFGKHKTQIPVNKERSIVFYRNNDPIIHQTFRVLIPKDIDQLKNCHLFFRCKSVYRYKTPDTIGFAFMKLFSDYNMMQQNKQYELMFYRNLKQHKVNYLECKDLQCENKTVKISFQLISTHILPDIDFENGQENEFYKETRTW